MKWILQALIVASAVTASVPSTVSASGTPQCGAVPFTRQSDDGAFQIEARSTTCATARMVASASKPSRFRHGDSSYTAYGFSCSGRSQQLGGAGKQVVRFRCLRQQSSVSFLRG